MIRYFYSALDGTLIDSTTSVQSGSGSNGNEEVFHIPQSSKTEASISDGLMLYSRHWGKEGVLPLWRNAIDIFYNPSQLGHTGWRETYPFAEMKLVRSTAPSKLGHSLGKSYLFAEMQSVYSTTPSQRTGLIFFRNVLPPIKCLSYQNKWKYVKAKESLTRTIFLGFVGLQKSFKIQWSDEACVHDHVSPKAFYLFIYFLLKNTWS